MTAKHLSLGQNGSEPKLHPDAIKKLLPPMEAFVGKDKYSQAFLFIKKFKDFKMGSSDFKECVMMQIARTMSLQDEDD